MQTAHGLRSTALTAGQDVLRLPVKVIQRQMTHAVEDKIRQAYDHSTMLDERRQFMVMWCDALMKQGLITKKNNRMTKSCYLKFPLFY